MYRSNSQQRIKARKLRGKVLLNDKLQLPLIPLLVVCILLQICSYFLNMCMIQEGLSDIKGTKTKSSSLLNLTIYFLLNSDWRKFTYEDLILLKKSTFCDETFQVWRPSLIKLLQLEHLLISTFFSKCTFWIGLNRYKQNLYNLFIFLFLYRAWTR